MPAEREFPGLQRSQRKDGSVALHWVASRKAVRAGYLPKTVRLTGIADESPELSARCRQLDAEQTAWLARQRDGQTAVRYDGTFAGLLTLYETIEESPYRRLARHSIANADHELRILRQTVGDRRLEKLNGLDFRRWHRQFRRPRAEGEPQRPYRAYSLIARVRGVLSFGVEADVPHAKRLRDILSAIRFPMPPAREQKLGYEQACAFIRTAHELGYHEMALAQALQFELTLRQVDVIGKYEYIDDDRTQVEWMGLCWQHIHQDLILKYKTSKRGRPVVFDLNNHELVRTELSLISPMPDIGPIIIDSETGEPFEYQAFRSRWRKIARAAGIPDEIDSRDSRAGGISEASSAGAADADLVRQAGHAQARTTLIYIRESLESTNRIAEARAKRRTRTSA